MNKRDRIELILLGFFLGVWLTSRIAQYALEQQAIEYELRRVLDRVQAEAYPIKRRRFRRG